MRSFEKRKLYVAGWLTEQERVGFLPEDEEEGGLQGERKADRHVNVSRPCRDSVKIPLITNKFELF